MENNSFNYTYSATENKEVLEIRKKYVPEEESKLDELKRLDRAVQNAGMLESLTVGITGALIFGVGMCIGLGALAGSKIVAVVLGVIGAAVMFCAHPVCRICNKRKKEQHLPRILKLSEELINENT